jgi:hypothetical protein
MVDYPSRSEHKMLKSYRCPPLQQRSYRTGERRRLSQPYEFLTQRGVSYFARRPSISSPTRRSA